MLRLIQTSWFHPQRYQFSGSEAFEMGEACVEDGLAWNSRKSHIGRLGWKGWPRRKSISSVYCASRPLTGVRGRQGCPPLSRAQTTAASQQATWERSHAGGCQPVSRVQRLGLFASNGWIQRFCVYIYIYIYIPWIHTCSVTQRSNTSPPCTPWCVCSCVPSRVQLFVTIWTVAREDPLSMGFSKQEYWSGLPFPSPGDLPNPGIVEPESLALAGSFFTAEPPRKPVNGSR